MKIYDSLIIGTWNVRGLSNDIKKEELARECEKYKIDILAIQETKIASKEDLDINNILKLKEVMMARVKIKLEGVETVYI